MVSKIQFSPPLLLFIMITPKKLSTIAQEYTPDLLNEWFDAFIRYKSYSPFLYLKDEVLKEKNHPEWFLRLKNLIKKQGIGLWNEFIDFCLGEVQKLNYKDFSIDFSDCTFENEEECNFSGIELPNIIFNNTTFTNEACFQEATFKNKADFQRATFKNKANFESAKFKGFLDLGNIVLKDSVNFKNTVFESGNFQNESFTDISFDGAIFKKANFQNKKFKNASFENATFKDKADFQGATFKDKANFGNTTFEDGAIFEKATFENEANFKKAIFRGEADFENATFQGEAIFQETLFETAFDKKIDFSKAVFKGVAYFTFPTKASNPTTDIYAELSFENATFEQETTFHRRKFFGDTSFIGAEFHFPPAFSMGEEYNPHLLNFTRTKLILSKPPQTLSLRETDIKKENKKIDSKPLTRVRNLRKLAGQIKEHDFERDLFILERLLNSRIAIKKWRYNPLKWIQQLLIGLYWISSNYGRSALIPFLWWVGFILGLSSFLSCVNKFNFCDALIVNTTKNLLSSVFFLALYP